jgi:hypothetical protein
VACPRLIVSVTFIMLAPSASVLRVMGSLSVFRVALHQTLVLCENFRERGSTVRAHRREVLSTRNLLDGSLELAKRATLVTKVVASERDGGEGG